MSMQHIERSTKAPRWAHWALLFLGASLALVGQAQTADTDTVATRADVPAQADEPVDSTAAQEAMESNRLKRRGLVTARHEANLERARNAKQEPPPALSPTKPLTPPLFSPSEKRGMTESTETASVVALAAAPAAALARVDVSFSFGRGLDAVSTSDAWLPSCSGIQEGDFTVIARVQARNAQGQPVDVRPEWKPADPATVSVSPAGGDAVRITVRGAGESNLTVVGPGFSKDLWISAVRQGKVMHVDIFQ